MKRISSLAVPALLLVTSCSIKGSLLGKSGAPTPSSPEPEPIASADSDEPPRDTAPKPRTERAEDEPGERARTAMATVAEVEKQCPNTEEPPPTEEACYAAIEASEAAFRRVGTDLELPVVRAARAIVYDADKLKFKWRQYRADEEEAADKLERAYKESVKGLGGEFSILANGKKNEASSPLTSSNATDRDWIKYRMQSYNFADLDAFLKTCKGTDGSSELKWKMERAANCELAKNRKKYYRQWVEAGVMAAILERSGHWENAVERLERRGTIHIRNYDALSSNKSLMKAAGGKAQAIIQATGVKVQASKELTRQLRPLRSRFEKALAKWGKKSQWKKQAGKAKRTDGGAKSALKRNVREIAGLKMVKYGVYNSAWDVINGPHGRPIERIKNTAVMGRKAGEKFCRIYHVRVVQDHRGGGRYGKTKAYVGGFEAFYISACR